MVVIYDRFVFFSVEKFFIPLLYSCLNILVQRSCASTSERASECMCMCVRMRACVCVCVYVFICIHVIILYICVRVGGDVSACERGGKSRERVRKKKRIVEETYLSENVKSAERETNEEG